VVTNCILQSISHGDQAGDHLERTDFFRNVEVSNCADPQLELTRHRLLHQGWRDGGALSFSNLLDRDARSQGHADEHFFPNSSCIPLYNRYRAAHPPVPHRRGRDVTFSDIQVTSDNSGRSSRA